MSSRLENSSADFYKNEEVTAIRLETETKNGLNSSSWINFTERDISNAKKLKPLDLRDFLELGIRDGEQLLASKTFPIDLDKEVQIPVSLTYFKSANDSWSSSSSTVNLSWSGVESIPNSWKINLFDSATSESFNLQTTDSITVNLEPQKRKIVGGLKFDRRPALRKSSVDNRFYLVVTPGDISGTNPGEIPAEVILHQNYPNPFNPTTTIEFALPEPSDVQIEIYNMLGHRIALLQDGAFSAGYHSIEFDATSFSSGIYIYRLNTGEKVLTRKMTLLK